MEHGVEGLYSRPRKYSGDFKISVVEYMHNTGSSLQKTAAHFNISCRNLIKRWECIYYSEGKGALYEERRDRARKMEIKKPRKPKKNINENEDLLAEVQRLRMENEYLNN